MQIAAHKAANKATHEAAAQHIAGLGAAIGHGDIAAKANQTADKIALERAGFVQRTVGVVAILYQGGQGGRAQAAAGGAGAAIQRHIAGIARDAAKELAQNGTLPGLVAPVVGPGQHGALVGQPGQGGGGVAGGVQVARNAARKGVAHHGSMVADAGQADCAGCIHQVGNVQHAKHAAHAHCAPQRLGRVFVCNSVITRFFCRIGAGAGVGAAVFVSIAVDKQARHSNVFSRAQVCQLRVVFGHGNADDAAKAMRLVFDIAAIDTGCANRVVAKSKRSRHYGLASAIAAALNCAFFQAARVQADQCADRPDFTAVRCIFFGQRLQILRVAGVYRHCICRLRPGSLYLHIDLHIRVT